MKLYEFRMYVAIPDDYPYGPITLLSRHLKHSDLIWWGEDAVCVNQNYDDDGEESDE